jgi:aminopeptidase I
MPRPYHAAPRVVPQQIDPLTGSATSTLSFPESTEHTEQALPHFEPADAMKASSFDASTYTKPFISFMNANPTVYHAVSGIAERLKQNGFTELSERDLWIEKLKKGGKYFYGRHYSSLVAFSVGEKYEPGNGAAIVAAHIDSLAAKVKPISTKPIDKGIVQLGVGTYGGSLNHTWFDRDLGIGGRILVRNKGTGKVESRLAKIDRPIGRIPTIAPHFGLRPEGQPNKEIRMVPIIGLDNSDLVEKREEMPQPLLRGASGNFASTQPERLVRAISKELGVTDCM